MNPTEPLEKILIKAETVHFEVTKNNFKDLVFNTKTIADLIQTNLLDLYANYCGNKCDVQ